MKKILASAVLTVAALSFTSAAHAGLYLEPFVGYETGKSKQSGSQDEDLSGTDLGARIGFANMGFSVGGEFDSANITLKPKSGPNDKVAASSYGAFVGFKFPALFRVYGSYLFKTTAKVDGVPNDFTGSGMRIGVGFTGLPLVSINLEMVGITLNKWNDVSLNNDIKMTATELSVSLPFSF